MWLAALLPVLLAFKISPGRLPFLAFPFLIVFALWELEFLSHRFSDFANKIGFVFLFIFYRLYSTVNVYDDLHAYNLRIIGLWELAQACYPIAIPLFSSIVAILLHIIAHGLDPPKAQGNHDAK